MSEEITVVPAATPTPTDLRFYESKIKEGVRQIENGFAAIQEKKLWQLHPAGYNSFADYCRGEWAEFAMETIRGMIWASEPARVVESTTSLPPPKKLAHSRALVRGKKKPEGVVGIWEQVLQSDAVQGDAGRVTVPIIEAQIEAAINRQSGTFYIGCPVEVDGPDECRHNGIQGYVVGLEGDAALRVELDGGTLITILCDWATKLDPSVIEPRSPDPTPAPTPKSEDKEETAIALLQELLDQGLIKKQATPRVQSFLGDGK